MLFLLLEADSPDAPVVLPLNGFPLAGRPFAGRPVADLPLTDRPVAGLSLAGLPLAGLPLAERPLAGRLFAERPPSGFPCDGCSSVGLPLNVRPFAGRSPDGLSSIRLSSSQPSSGRPANGLLFSEIASLRSTDRPAPGRCRSDDDFESNFPDGVFLPTGFPNGFLGPDRGPLFASPGLGGAADEGIFAVAFFFFAFLGFIPAAARSKNFNSTGVSGRCAPTGKSPIFSGPMETRLSVRTLFPMLASIRRISRLRPSARTISIQLEVLTLRKNFALVAFAFPSAR